MGTLSFDFLTESLLFQHDHLDNNFENVEESELRKALDEYREFCDQNTAALRNEVANTQLTVFPGLRRSTDLKSITQSAFYLDQYLLDDPLYSLSFSERRMDSRDESANWNAPTRGNPQSSRRSCSLYEGPCTIRCCKLRQVSTIDSAS